MARITYLVSVSRNVDGGEWRFADTMPEKGKYDFKAVQAGIYLYVDPLCKAWLEKPTASADWKLIEVIYDTETRECY